MFFCVLSQTRHIDVPNSFLWPLSGKTLHLFKRPTKCRPQMIKKWANTHTDKNLHPFCRESQNLLQRGSESDLNVVVLGSLPAVDSCLSDRHVSLESRPHIPEPLSVVTTKAKKIEERERKKERFIHREREKREKCVLSVAEWSFSAMPPHWKHGAECVSTSLWGRAGVNPHTLSSQHQWDFLWAVNQATHPRASAAHAWRVAV